MQDIELETAIDQLLFRATVCGKETVPLLAAAQRTVAETIIAPFANPPFDRSPLDGYALRAAETAGATRAHPARLHIIGEECAGDFFAGRVGAGEAVRIMTGAAIPAGCNCVVRQEDVEEEAGVLCVPYALRAHENICDAGEDIAAGTVLLCAGQVLHAPEIAVLASMGIAEVAVYCQPRVALASTGDELVTPGEPLAPGKIYNSNLYLLAARLRELGASVTLLDALPDEAETAARALREAAATADLLLTTGGVSVGKKDIMHAVVPAMGAERIFWRICMKPGAPAIGYQCGRTLGIALSGNPFAAYATFELLVRPVLRKMKGRSELALPRQRAVLADDFLKASPGRRFLRARLTPNGRAHLPDRHASGVLFTAVGCNAFVDVPAGTGPLHAGDEVEVVLL